jgi:hypothetical protein
MLMHGGYMDMDTVPTLEGASLHPTAPATDEMSQRRILAIYKQMLLSLFLATLIVAAVLAILLFPFYHSYINTIDPSGKVPVPVPPSLLTVVQLAGALGAFFSALIRLYNFEDLPKAMVARELEGLPRLHLLIYSLVPAVIGAIAASVIHMLFAAGLLQGDFFPVFKCGNVQNVCNSFGSLIGDWGPAEAKDYAKDIVWGFVAGFAERLVPDTLQALSRTAQKESSTANAE